MRLHSKAERVRGRAREKEADHYLLYHLLFDAVHFFRFSNLRFSSVIFVPFSFAYAVAAFVLISLICVCLFRFVFKLNIFMFCCSSDCLGLQYACLCLFLLYSSQSFDVRYKRVEYK